ncbi:MAG: MFS transporter [Chloroflexota bacterium]|nr:MFS transporter [Chloroflexota bacterium]
MATISRYLPSSMRYGQFRYYWLALLAGVTGHQMLLQFTLGWLIYRMTGEPRYIAYLGVAIAIPALALNLIGGVLADRWEPKYLVAAAQSVSATVVVVLAILVLNGDVKTWHILAAGVIIGAVQAFDAPSRSSISPRLVRTEHIVNAVAMDSIVWNVVRVLSPALAGIIIAWRDIPTSMFISAASFYLLAAVLTILRLRPRPLAKGRFAPQVAESLRYVRQRPVFFNVMLLTCCNSLFGMSYVFLMPVFAKDVLDVGAEKIGLLLGTSGVGAIIGTWYIGNLKDGAPKGQLILTGAALYGLTQILFAMAAWQGSYTASMAMLILVGASNSLYLVGGLSTIQQLVPEQLRGRVMGLYGITWSLAPLGMTQGGMIAQYIGAPWAVALGAMVMIVVSGLMYVLSPDLRNLRAGAVEQLPPTHAVSVADDDD